jgi:FAD:protein FMN transferase
MLSSMHIATNTPALHKCALTLMGNRFEITVVAEDRIWANERIGAAVNEIRRIEQLLTTFKEDSQTSLINRNAGIAAVPVDQEVFRLIQRSLKISQLTQGAFDITYGGIDKKLWNFDTKMTSLPDAQYAKRLTRLIDYRKVILNENNFTVFLKEKGMRIGFGGIGKGYAAEQAKALLKSQGVTSGLVNAAGDLAAWGYQPDGAPWTIGVADPRTANRVFARLSITDLAVATSGNYEKYIIVDGKRYSHTINPKTGLPVTGIKSVTVISSNAEIADAMATPVMIMGVETGLDLVNQVNDLACILIDDDDSVFTSKNVTISKYAA